MGMLFRAHSLIATSDDLNGINLVRTEVREDPNDPHEIKNFEAESIVENQHQVTFVSKSENNVIGYLNLHYHCPYKGTYATAMLEMFVMKNFRGQGIGNNLIENAITYCKVTQKFKKIVLTVLDNNKAINLYQRKGFIVTSIENDGKWMALEIKC